MFYNKRCKELEKDYLNLLEIYKIQEEQLKCYEAIKCFIKDKNIFSLYSKNEIEFIISLNMKCIYSKYILSITTYNLFNMKKVCNSELQFYKNKDYVSLVNLSVKNYSEYRNGHGSKQINLIKNICETSGRKRIIGKLYPKTPIGLDNLIRFYKKNGFTINYDRLTFYMDL